MAEQFDIDDLVRQLKSLVEALNTMGKTGGAGGAVTGSNRDMDRLLRAIATMATSMDKGAKSSAKAIDEFVKNIDKAIDAQEETVRAQQRAQAEVDQAGKVAARQAYEAAEESRRRSMSAAELAREAADAEREARAEHVAGLQSGYQKEYGQLQEKLYKETNYAKRLASLKDEEAKSTQGFSGAIDKMALNYGKGGGDMVAFYQAVNNAKRALDMLSPLGKGIADMGKALYEGKQGASANNSVIEGFGDTVEKITSGLGPLGIIVGKIVKLFTGFAVEANKMSDRFYKTYQDLSRAGVAASDGMTGLAESAQRLGLGLDESGLQNFVRILGAASEDIAMLSGSAIQGRKDFTEFSSSIVRGDVGRQLMNMGMSVEAINEGVASFVKQQVSLGRAQGMTNQQLAAGAAAYLKEMDALTKLTGIQKQELENQMDSNRRNERFRAAIEKVRQEQGDEAAQALELNMAVASKRFPELAEGLKDIASGFVTTDAARKALAAGMADVPKQMTRGIGSGFQELGRAAKSTTQAMGGLAEVGAFGDVFGSYYEQLKAAGMSEQDAVKEAKKILEDRKRQEEGAGDAATAAQTNMRRQQMDSRDALQDFVKAGVAPATKAMEGFTSVTSKVVTALGGTVAGGMAGGGGGGLAAGGGTATGGGVSTAGAGGGGVFGAIGRFGARMAAGGIGTTGTMSEDDLRARGLVLKKGDVQAKDGALNPRLVDLAQKIQSDIPGFAYFSGFNDRFHQEKSPSSAHTQGLAADFALSSRPSPEQGQAIVNQLKSMGFATAIDEYNAPSAKATAGHFHAAIQAATGGVFSGPRSGYNAMLHGTEAVVPLPDGKTIPVEMPNLDRNMEQQVGMMGAQLIALEELVRYMRDNNAINTKILQAANN